MWNDRTYKNIILVQRKVGGKGNNNGQNSRKSTYYLTYENEDKKDDNVMYSTSWHPQKPFFPHSLVASIHANSKKKIKLVI